MCPIFSMDGARYRCQPDVGGGPKGGYEYLILCLIWNAFKGDNKSAWHESSEGQHDS